MELGLDWNTIIYSLGGFFVTMIGGMAGYIVRINNRLFTSFEANTIALIQFRDTIEKTGELNQKIAQILEKNKEYFTRRIDNIEKVINKLS